MPSLKDLKVRIGSVKSTQKITKAMKMVAASKLRKARERAEAAKPYARRTEAMLSSLARDLSGANLSPLLVGTGKQQTYLLVITSSDKGLCGAFNGNIFKETRKLIASLESKNKDIKLLCVGKKAHDYLKNRYANKILDYVDTSKYKKIGFKEADAISAILLHHFEKGAFDVCMLVYSNFISVISQQAKTQQIIPLDTNKDTAATSSKESIQGYHECEPSEEEIVEKLLPKNIAVQILHALLENDASEQGARMTAMDNATRNAGDMIKRLSLLYNRTRQAYITRELIEIISGSEAV